MSSSLEPEFIEQQKVILQNLLDRLSGSDAKVNTEKVSDEADLGAVEDEANTMLSMISSNRNASTEVHAALKRIELGSYGICELSKEPIPRARLEAVPWARYTLKTQQTIEKREKARKSGSQQYGVSSVFAAEEAEVEST